MCVCVFHSLHMGKNDLLTFYDGDDLTAKILGQYGGTRPRFKLYTTTADVTIQFQSDPATNIYGYNNGFVVHFFGTNPLPLAASVWAVNRVSLRITSTTDHPKPIPLLKKTPKKPPPQTAYMRPLESVLSVLIKSEAH